MRYASRGDYWAAVSQRREEKERRRKEWRKKPHVWRENDTPYWLTFVYAVHPDNENAPWLPMFWRYRTYGERWSCLVATDRADEVESQARLIFGIQSDMEERNG